MLRTFSEHDVRMVESLDGRWDFVTADDVKGRRRLPAAYTRTIHVPSAWETLPGLENYRGRAWLRTSVAGVEGLALRLVFGGVSHTGTVYVAGRRVGKHYDAFTPWDVVVPGLKTGAHELVLEVDNSFGPHSALHIENDYYTYGGLTRPVEAQWVPEVYIDRLDAVPRREGRGWSLDVCVHLRNWGRRAGTRDVLVMLGDTAIRLGPVTVGGGATHEVHGTLSGLTVEPWTADTPHLYFVEGQLIDGETVVDDLVDRVGFRVVEVRGKKLLLNGQPLRLQGYNRHEDHPQFGCAIPVEAMVQDLELLADLGSNFVRTCHYPNDLRFLDLCDEMGFYVWEESHARTIDFAHPKYREQIIDSTTEMVTWHRNRPSIIIWGCLNECESRTPAGRGEHARVLRLLKRLDPTRPTTFASMYAQADACLGLVDIVAWNRYDAWYGGGIPDVEPNLRKVLRWLHSAKSRGGQGKPVIMSEFGAGAIYGHHRPGQQGKWSEEYQAAVLDESLRVYLAHPDVVGVAIWQFCDVRVTKNWWNGRPRTMNNKGTVDEYRRPKLAYGAVRRRLLAVREQKGTGAGRVRASQPKTRKNAT